MDDSSSSLLVGQVDNYSAVFGEENADQKYSKPTVIGNVRNPKRFTWVEWIFLILSIIAFTGTLGITVERLISFKENFNLTGNASEEYLLSDCHDWTCTSDFTFAILLIANILFCLFYAIDGVVRERGFEILAIPVAIVTVLIYIVGNYIYQKHERKEPFRIARLILASLFGPPLVALAIWIYVRNGRLQFNVVGSNKTLMRVYRIRSFVTTLLTFNLHVMCNFVILVMARHRTFVDEVEKIIVIIFMLYVLLITPIGWFGFNYEVIWLTVLFSVLFFPTVAYYIYKIIDVGKNIREYWSYEGNYNHHLEAFRFIAVTLFVVSSLGVLIYGLVLTFTFLAARDYQKGLNEKIDPPFKTCLPNRKRNVDATFTPST